LYPQVHWEPQLGSLENAKKRFLSSEIRHASVNLVLDDFDEDYLDECSGVTCADCGYKIEFDTFIVDKGTFIEPGE